MNFIDYVNGLKVPMNSRPVSFEFHCKIGAIFADDTPEVNTTELRDLQQLDSEEIPFLP